MPFVQGRLREQAVTVEVETECAHCSQPIRLEIDSKLDCRVLEKECDPFVFVPLVDFGKVTDPNIIDVF